MPVARPTLVFNMCATWSTKVQQSTIAKKNIYNDLKNREAIDWNLIELLNKYDVQQSQQPVHVSMVFHAFCLCHSWEVSSKIKGHTSFRSPNSWPRSWSWPRSMDSMDSPAEWFTWPCYTKWTLNDKCLTKCVGLLRSVRSMMNKYMQKKNTESIFAWFYERYKYQS